MCNTLGEHKCEIGRCTWSVMSDGKAYSDSPSTPVAYRWSDGTWHDAFVVKSEPVVASSKLEEIFAAYLSSVNANPIDPLRHLRKK